MVNPIVMAALSTGKVTIRGIRGEKFRMGRKLGIGFDRLSGSRRLHFFVPSENNGVLSRYYG